MILVLCGLFALQLVTAQTNVTTPAPIECSDAITCGGQGRCKLDGEGNFEDCICYDDYTTHPNPPEGDDTYCNYKQKTQLTAFLLHFFVGSQLALILITLKYITPCLNFQEPSERDASMWRTT